MDDHTNNLLNAEAAVEALHEELRKLAGEVGSYANASSNLDQAQQQLKALVEKHAQLTEQAKGVITKLAEIGTPELMSALEQLSKIQADSIEASQQTREQLAAKITSLGQAVAQTNDELKKVVSERVAELDHATRNLNNTVSQRTEGLAKNYAEAMRALTGDIKQIEQGLADKSQELKAQQDKLGRRLGLLTFIAGLAALLAAAAAVLSLPHVQRILGG